MRRSVAFAVPLLAALCAATPSEAAITCDQTASPSGAIATAQALVTALSPGQTGCLRAGTYVGDVTVDKQVTLTSYGGEAVTLRGRVQVTGAGAVLQKLLLDGRNASNVPSPTISAANVVLRDNDITNVDTAATCVTVIGTAPNGVLIERNRIHDCGLAPTNVNHGIDLQAGTGAIVRENVVYDNAARGIQVRGTTSGAQVTNNTVDGNGQGVNFGSAVTSTAVTDNVISNSVVRWNIESNTPGAGNSAIGNCLQASNANSYYNSNGGAAVVEGLGTDVNLGTGNPVANPQYVNRAAKDLRLGATTGCGTDGAPATVAGLAPDTTIESGPSGTITTSSAQFTFSSSRPGATFECALNSTTYTACTNPRSLSGLTSGAHTFRVRAVVGGVADPTPAERTFTYTPASVCSVVATTGTNVTTAIGGLTNGQTLCFRAGTYGSSTSNTNITQSNVTIRSYPGETATLTGRLVVKYGANGVRIEGLRLLLPTHSSNTGLVLSGNDAVVRNNDISGQDNKVICVHPKTDPDASGATAPLRFLIEANRIHDCGNVASTTYSNFEHGIYVSDGVDGIIRDNVIYDNIARGIQLAPNAQSTTVTRNTVDGNGQGVSYGGTSSNNAVTNNVVSNSYNRWNFESSGLTGTGNTAIGNCVLASHPTDPWYNGNGGVAIDDGFATDVNIGTGNPIADPQYVNRAGKDFRVQNSACAAKAAPASVANPAAFPVL